MLNFAVYKSSKHLEAYFKDHLEKGDYHSEDGSIDGEWIGTLCKDLGLTEGSKVESIDFQSLTRGKHPISGEILAQRRNAVRRVAYDFSFSAPKSVSIVALIGKDKRVIKAHRKAVKYTFSEMEKEASQRIRSGHYFASEHRTRTGKLVAAQFDHTTSRANDPQLHSHLVTFNTTSVDGKTFKALQAIDIVEKKAYFTAVYRNELARGLLELGYKIEKSQHGWRIAGVSEKLEDIFSNRTKEIESALAETAVTNASQKQRSYHALRSRQKKSAEKADDVHDHSRKQLSQAMRVSVDEVVKKALVASGEGKAKAETAAPAAFSKQAIDFAIKHNFERLSVMSKSELAKSALDWSCGLATLPEIEKAMDDSGLLQWKDLRAELSEEKNEKAIVQFVASGVGIFPKLGIAREMVESNESQAVLESKDRFTIVSGKPGTGKTTLLKEILQNVDGPIYISAPRSGAAQKLRDDGFTHAQTLKKLITNLSKEAGALKPHETCLIVIDEAGLMSTKGFADLMGVRGIDRARFLLLGDDRQHHSVDSGDVFRLISDHTKTKIIELNQIKRQSTAELRKVTSAFSNSLPHEGLRLLREQDRLFQMTDRKRHEHVARRYCEELASGRSVLVVTPTWSESRAITEAIRSRLKSDGLLEEKEVQHLRFESLKYTMAQKCSALFYRENQAVVMHRDLDQLKRGEILRVVNCSLSEVTLKTQKGQELVLSPHVLGPACDVGEIQSIGIAVGDKLLLQANLFQTASSQGNQMVPKHIRFGDRASRVSGEEMPRFNASQISETRHPDGNTVIPNGTVLEVASIDVNGNIHSKCGKEIPFGFPNLTHGFCLTSQASQGKDADTVIVSIDTSQASAISTNQMNVSVSRGRSCIEVYTDSIKRLENSVSKTERRKLIAEIFPNQEQLEKIYSRFPEVKSCNVPIANSSEKTTNMAPKDGSFGPHPEQPSQYGI